MVARLHRNGSSEPQKADPRSNGLLAGLPETEFEQLRSGLQYASFSTGDVLHEPNQLIARGFFVVTGLVSRLAVMEDGEQVEVGLIGDEGLVGSQIVLGSDRSTWRTVVQVSPTTGYGLSAELMRKAFRTLPHFQSQVLRHIRAQTAIVTYIAACNCIHDAGQRLARWLLMCQDRLGSETLPLTQEFLAQMLGVQRTTITLVARQMHDAGLISSGRGRITVLDRQRLEQAACECYAAVRAQYIPLSHKKQRL